MTLKELKEELNNDVQTIVSDAFDVTIAETFYVPTIDTEGITYPNLDSKEMKAKKIYTCVLYIDMRKSTELSLEHTPETLTKLYGAFMRSMVKAAQYHNGRVRNIIGDRVMVVFDEFDCETNAVNTAILLNSVGSYIINKHFPHNEIEFGIGIDYGEMLVSKGGIRKNGKENAPYKSLVWLGKPANVASKLTDLANKTVDIKTEERIEVMRRVHVDNLPNKDLTMKEFFENDFVNFSGWEKFEESPSKHAYVCRNPSLGFYYLEERIKEKEVKVKTPSILMTESVYDAYIEDNPEDISVKSRWWKKQPEELYKGHKVYGGGVIFTAFKED
ncbi:MAG: adenylate/guanylate cyclase domain-containing protein [Bacillota bacterium]